MRRFLWLGVLAAAALAALFFRPLAAVGKILLVAGVLAAMLFPAQRRLESRLKRGTAAALCMALLLGALAALILLCVPALAEQIKTLRTALPQLAARTQALLGRVERFFAQLGISLSLDWDVLTGAVGARLGTWTGQAVSVAADAGQYLLSPVIAFYLLRDRERLRDGVLRALPPAWREGWERFFADFSNAFGDYLRAQGIVSLFTGLSTALLLRLIGLEAALLLGFLMALFNVIPYFGPVLGAVPALLAALPGGLGRVLWTLAAIVAVQQVESLAVTPRLMGPVCGFHPAAVMLLIVFSAAAFGLWGMLLAVPAATLVRCAVKCAVMQKIYGKNI